MYQYRQTLVRMRQGDSDREIARSKTMGRKKIAQVREVANARGWLAAGTDLPDDTVLAAALMRDAVLIRMRAVQGVLRLKQKYGATRLEAACSRANHYGTPGFKVVKSILEKELDQQTMLAAFDALNVSRSVTSGTSSRQVTPWSRCTTARRVSPPTFA